MGLRLDEDAVAADSRVILPPPELPRHAREDHDHKLHTFDDKIKRQDDPHNELEEDAEEEEDDQEEQDGAASDKRPLLQDATAWSDKVAASLYKPSAKVVPVASHASGSSSSSCSAAAARVKRLRGLGYIVFAALNISLMSACVKFATHRVTSHEAVFWRTILTWVLNYVLVRAKRVDLHVAPQHRKLLLFRSFIGMVCVSLSYYAVSKMVLTDAIVIIFTSPVLTFLMGAVLLGEAINRVDFLCALLSYVGVLFVTRPAMLFPHTESTKQTDSIAVLCALGAAATQACAYIAMRKLHEVHYMAISHYFSLFGIGFSLATLWIFGSPLCVPELFTVQLALVASAVFSCVGLLFLTLGFQMEKAGIASVMRYFDVVFVFILDTTFLGEDVDAYSVLGGAIIIAGAVVIAIRRARAKK